MPGNEMDTSNAAQGKEEKTENPIWSYLYSIEPNSTKNTRNKAMTVTENSAKFCVIGYTYSHIQELRPMFLILIDLKLYLNMKPLRTTTGFWLYLSSSCPITVQIWPLTAHTHTRARAHPVLQCNTKSINYLFSQHYIPQCLSAVNVNDRCMKALNLNANKIWG